MQGRAPAQCGGEHCRTRAESAQVAFWITSPQRREERRNSGQQQCAHSLFCFYNESALSPEMY